MTTTDELESRLRFVEADVASEKEVSLATLQQCVRNGAALSNLRTELSATTLRLDPLVADAAITSSSLRHHSTLLAVLQQDVTAFRLDVTSLRRGQEELHVRIDKVEGRLEAVEGRLEAVEKRLEAVEGRLDQFQAEVAMRFDRLETSVAAILAAVAPQKPPAVQTCG